MDANGIYLASIERVIQGGGQVSNNGAQFLLDRLRAAEAELRVAEDQANNNAADAIAAEAKVTEIEIALESSKVTSQNWFRNCMEARTERNSLKARAAEAEAVITEAPHEANCNSHVIRFDLRRGTGECTCWKSRHQAWLARVKKEAKAEALEEAIDHSRTENGEGDLLTTSWLRARAAELREQVK